LAQPANLDPDSIPEQACLKKDECCEHIQTTGSAG